MAVTAPYASTLAADAARVTELAAIASYAQIGRGESGRILFEGPFYPRDVIGQRPARGSQRIDLCGDGR